MSNVDTRISPFRIDVPQADLDDLRRRLIHTRRTGPQLPGTGWERGVPSEALGELVAYWATGFDWRAQEARINAWPQFTTEIDGATIHFLHVRSPERDAFPLLLTHGWPGTFAEYLEFERGGHFSGTDVPDLLAGDLREFFRAYR